MSGYIVGWLVMFLIVISLWVNLFIKVKQKEKQKIQKNPIRKFRSLKEEREEWRNRIDNSKHLLTGISWQDSEGKREFIEELFGYHIPDFLWYAVGKFTTPLTEEELKEISRIFWYGEVPFSCGYEFIKTHDPEIGTALCIRNAKDLVAEVIVGGKVCPLYQIGNLILGRAEEGCVIFPRLYD